MFYVCVSGTFKVARGIFARGSFCPKPPYAPWKNVNAVASSCPSAFSKTTALRLRSHPRAVGRVLNRPKRNTARAAQILTCTVDKKGVGGVYTFLVHRGKGKGTHCTHLTLPFLGWHQLSIAAHKTHIEYVVQPLEGV